MRLLVTGATGFIGQHLSAYWAANGHEVHALVREKSSRSKLDARVRTHACDDGMSDLLKAVRSCKPDVTIHLASFFRATHATDEIAEMLQTNVVFATELVEAICNEGYRSLINTGTTWQHFNSATYDPMCLYAATKQAFEDILEFYVQAHGLNVVTLKISDTYGPSDPRRKLVDILMRAIGSPAQIDLSPGDQRLDLVHVEDVVCAFDMAAHRLMSGQVHGHERYRIGAGALISIRELVAAIERATGKTTNVRFGKRPYRAREVMLPACPNGPLPGWSARIDLDEGLRRLAKNYV